jgi:hypothetical protein
MSKVDMALLRPDQVAKIGQLTSLGFVENDVFDALRASRGDAQKALARLEAALADKVHQLVATGASESAARDALSRSGHDVVRAESLLTVWKKKKKKKKKKKIVSHLARSQTNTNNIEWWLCRYFWRS